MERFQVKTSNSQEGHTFKCTEAVTSCEWERVPITLFSTAEITCILNLLLMPHCLIMNTILDTVAHWKTVTQQCYQ